ncbi:MAG: uridine kinase [Bacteroidia bacterium]
MINEHIKINESYFAIPLELIKRMQSQSLFQKEKLVIGICGESGSGKSVTAICLQMELEKQNKSSVILHLDNYFKLPPKDNHNKRKRDLSWVGTKEVCMDLLQSHIQQFLLNKEKVVAPSVDYKKNEFSECELLFKDIPILIVEGVYTLLLKDLDFKVFMERTFIETKEKRKERNREVYDPFVEQVLQIEHNLIKPLAKKADVFVTKDYSVRSRRNDDLNDKP